MKTDREKLKELLSDFGITGYSEDEKKISIKDRCCDKASGYFRFYVDFEFDGSGKFLNMGLYE